MEFTKEKWEVDKSGYKTANGGTCIMNGLECIAVVGDGNQYQPIDANALLISKAPEMIFELNETLKDLLVLQGNVLESVKIDKKWDGIYELIQTWIDRKKQLIKEATEIN